MPISQFTDGVEITGSQDVVQLNVIAHAAQTAPLQIWSDSSMNEVAQISHDGRLALGDDLGWSTTDAIIEAHRSEPSPRPTRAFHALGRVSGLVSNAVQWVVNELEIVGSSIVSGIYTTLRVRLRSAATGNSTDAELIAADIETFNESGSAEAKVGQLTALRARVINTSAGFADDVIALDVGVISNNTPSGMTVACGIRVGDITQAGANYAIYTGSGRAHFGDVIELNQITPQNNPPVGAMWLYPKPDGKLYALNADGQEVSLTDGGNSNGVKRFQLTEAVVIEEDEQADWVGRVCLLNSNAEIELQGPEAAFYIT